MADEKKPMIESAGWGFFIVGFLILLGPCIYGFYRLSYSDTSAIVWLGLGLLAAGGLSAVLTTLANSIIQSRLEKVRDAERKSAKKKKRG